MNNAFFSACECCGMMLPYTSFIDQVSRPISTGQLHTSPCFHLRPINLVIFKETYPHKRGKTNLGMGFPLRCFQRLSLRDVATLRCPWQDNRYTIGRSVPVLSY